MRPLTYLFVLALAVSLWSCREIQMDPLKKDMVQLDQAFIPIWYQVNAQDSSLALQRMKRFENAWTVFRDAHIGDVPESPDWQANFRLMADWVKESQAAIEAHEWQQAYIMLDHFRYELMEIRGRNHIPYFLDQLWEMQMSYDIVQETLNDQMMCHLEWDDVEMQIRDLNDQWSYAAVAIPDIRYYDWDNEQIQRFFQIRRDVEQKMVQFNQTVECADQLELAREGQQLGELIFHWIALFGSEAENGAITLNL